MRPTHRVFVQLPEGSRMLAASAASLGEARRHAERLSAADPGNSYVIVDVRTGLRVQMTANQLLPATAVGRFLLAPMPSFGQFQELTRVSVAAISRFLTAPAKLPSFKLPTLEQLHAMGRSLERVLLGLQSSQ